MTRIRIHRGFHQIGGSITEIFTDDTHIFIDFGSELNAETGKSTDSSMVDMMKCARCDAVLFTHYHGDHVGLIDNLPEKDIDGKLIKIGMGMTARKVLDVILESQTKYDPDGVHGKAWLCDAHWHFRRLYEQDQIF